MAASDQLQAFPTSQSNDRGAFDPFRPEGALDSSNLAAQGNSGVNDRSNQTNDVQEGSVAAVAKNPLAGAASMSLRNDSGILGDRQDSKRASGSGNDDLIPRHRERRNTMTRKSTIGIDRKATAAPLPKRSTLASMMLSTKYTTPNVPNPFEDEVGEHVHSERGSAEGEEHVADDPSAEAEQEGMEVASSNHGNTTGRVEVEQIFMPNMRREAYVPVRIARDKLRQVLKEMAQMKHMHYAAIETMEKQQEFLKAQMEATVATYARKLTGDYNDRVKALEAEYQRRLDGLNKTAMGELQATLAAAQRDAKSNEQRLLAQLQQKQDEIDKESQMFQSKIQLSRQAQQEAEQQAEELRRKLHDLQNENEQLNIELRVAKASTGDGRPSSADPSDVTSSLQRLVDDLKSQVEQLRNQNEALLNENKTYEQAIEERDHEIAQLQDQLASAHDGAGQLLVAGADENGSNEEGGLVIGNDDDEEPTTLQL